MVLCVGIQEAPNHALVLRIVLPRLALEELHAALAQRDGHLDALVPKDQVFRTGEEVRNDLEIPEGFVRVPNFLAHRFAFLCASNQLRRYG